MNYKQFVGSMNIHSKSVGKPSTDHVVEEVVKEAYEEIPSSKVAEIIKEHHDVRVTDTLIESYVELAASNIFSVDPVICELRKYNKIDRLVENKIHYVLSDKTIVAISEQTQERLNNLLQNQKDIIEYMRESKENFLYVLDKLEEQNGTN
jgi:hypothetical protein